MLILRHLIVSLIVFNAVFISWTFAAKSTDEAENWVKVEKSPIVLEEKDGEKKLRFISYRERRTSWNFRLAFGAESWSLQNHPVSTLQTAKIGADGVSFGLQLMASYNLSALSLGAGTNISMLNFEGGISAIKYGVDVHAYLDGIMNEPVVVPYAKLGLGQLSFSNPDASDVSSFETDIAMYYSLGFMFLLDWLQRSMAMDAFFNHGIQGSFVFIEYESFPSLKAAHSELPVSFDASGFKAGLQLVF